MARSRSRIWRIFPGATALPGPAGAGAAGGVAEGADEKNTCTLSAPALSARRKAPLLGTSTVSSAPIGAGSLSGGQRCSVLPRAACRRPPCRSSQRLVADVKSEGGHAVLVELAGEIGAEIGLRRRSLRGRAGRGSRRGLP